MVEAQEISSETNITEEGTNELSLILHEPSSEEAAEYRKKLIKLFKKLPEDDEMRPDLVRRIKNTC